MYTYMYLQNSQMFAIIPSHEMVWIYNMCMEKVEELIYDSYTTCPQRPKDLEIWISYYSSLFEIYFLWIHICFFCWCWIDGSWGLRPYAQLSIGFYFVGCLESSSVLFPCQLKISKCFLMVQVWGFALFPSICRGHLSREVCGRETKTTQ